MHFQWTEISNCCIYTYCTGRPIAQLARREMKWVGSFRLIYCDDPRPLRYYLSLTGQDKCNRHLYFPAVLSIFQILQCCTVFPCDHKQVLWSQLHPSKHLTPDLTNDPQRHLHSRLSQHFYLWKISFSRASLKNLDHQWDFEPSLSAEHLEY